MSFPALPSRPSVFPPRSGRPVPMVLDTDTFNEIDDQFALTHLLCAPDRVELRGVTAAPFFNERSTSPADGMCKSYEEIRHILRLTGRDGRVPVLRGSERYLPDRNTPVASAAARFLVEESRRTAAEGRKLYIGAIAVLTNVASALLLDPALSERAVVVWLGSHDYADPDNDEFNLIQDVAAAQTVFASGIPLVHFPCRGVASALAVTEAEMRTNLHDCGPVGAYLLKIFQDCMRGVPWRQRIIWDVAVSSFFTVPEATQWREIPTPQLRDDRSWILPDAGPSSLLAARRMDADAVFQDLFRRIKTFTGESDGPVQP